jgi:hypothetical protein
MRTADDARVLAYDQTLRCNNDMLRVAAFAREWKADLSRPENYGQTAASPPRFFAENDVMKDRVLACSYPIAIGTNAEGERE